MSSKTKPTVTPLPSQSSDASVTDRLEQWAKIVGAVLIPIVVLFVGARVKQSIQEESSRTELLKLSIGILQKPLPPSDEIDEVEHFKELRAWALKVIDETAPPELGMEPTTRKHLLDGQLLPNYGTDYIDSITGRDDRVLIEDMDQAPYSSLCQLRVITGGAVRREFFGTGFLISPRAVLTTGYHVYSPYAQDKKHNTGFAQEITVYVGLQKGDSDDGQGRYTRRFVVRNADECFRVPKEWEAASDKDSRIDDYRSFNFGVILLRDEDDPDLKADAEAEDAEKNPPREIAPLPFVNLKPFTDTEFSDRRFFVSGYPRDTDSFPDVFQASGKVETVGKDRLAYSIDTGDASSGAPIWRRQDNGQPAACGLHTSRGVVRGIRFTADNIQLIESWTQTE